MDVSISSDKSSSEEVCAVEGNNELRPPSWIGSLEWNLEGHVPSDILTIWWCYLADIIFLSGDSFPIGSIHNGSKQSQLIIFLKEACLYHSCKSAKKSLFLQQSRYKGSIVLNLFLLLQLLLRFIHHRFFALHLPLFLLFRQFIFHRFQI